MALLRDLGPYHIIRRIGKGGMGEVYLAEDTRKPLDATDRLVALKVMWKDSDAESTGVVEAERQGAVLQSRLYGVDNRVARVNGYGDLDDIFYLDMEFIEGKDLAELMAGGPMETSEVLRVGLEVADILARLHSMPFHHEGKETVGVIHGDIKPRNIRLENSGRVRLLDFGIAKALSKTRKLTRNEFGSITYASPERLDTGDVNELSDLWSLGVVLHEMLAGRPPFDAENTRKIEQRILSGTPSIPLPAGTPPVVVALLSRALARNPLERFPSASHFKIALKEARRALIVGNSSASVTGPRAENRYSNAATQVVEPVVRPIAPLAPEEIAATVKVPPVARPDEATTRTSRESSPEDPAELTRRTTPEARNGAAEPLTTRSSSPGEETTPASERNARMERRNGSEESSGRAFSFPSGAAAPRPSSPKTADLKATDLKAVDPKEPKAARGASAPVGGRSDGSTAASNAPLDIKGPSSENVPSLLTSDGTVAGMGSEAGGAVTAGEKVFPPPWLSKAAIALAVLGFVGAFLRQNGLERDARTLADEIQAQGVTCDAAWDQYQNLKGKSLLKPEFYTVRDPLIKLCENEVDQIIKRYRDDNPNLQKSDWRRAHEAALHLKVMSGEPRFMAWERYTSGQIDRIDDRYDVALSSFAQAIELQPTFCDPYYAELHLYAYSARKDYKHFLDAQLETLNNNCPLLPKHNVWKADVTFDYAEEQYKALDSSQENYRASLQTIRELYATARQVFSDNLKVGNARKKKVQCEKRMRDLDAKMAAFDEPLPDPRLLFGQ